MVFISPARSTDSILPIYLSKNVRQSFSSEVSDRIITASASVNVKLATNCPDEMVLLLARLAKGPAGFGIARRCRANRFLFEIAVIQEACGQGIGSALVSALVDAARAAAGHECFADVDVCNSASIRMFERNCFVFGSVRSDGRVACRRHLGS